MLRQFGNASLHTRCLRFATSRVSITIVLCKAVTDIHDLCAARELFHFPLFQRWWAYTTSLYWRMFLTKFTIILKLDVCTRVRSSFIAVSWSGVEWGGIERCYGQMLITVAFLSAFPKRGAIKQPCVAWGAGIKSLNTFPAKSLRHDSLRQPA
jgi:hypothetical protein